MSTTTVSRVDVSHPWAVLSAPYGIVDDMRDATAPVVGDQPRAGYPYPVRHR
jgi:hypothetical protein